MQAKQSNSKPRWNCTVVFRGDFDKYLDVGQWNRGEVGLDHSLDGPLSHPHHQIIHHVPGNRRHNKLSELSGRGGVGKKIATAARFKRLKKTRTKRLHSDKQHHATRVQKHTGPAVHPAPVRRPKIFSSLNPLQTNNRAACGSENEAQQERRGRQK